jgi:hypothetical protein
MTNIRRNIMVLLIALPFLLALSYPWRDATHGAGQVVSGIGWFGFLLDLLALLTFSIAGGIRSWRQKRMRNQAKSTA